MTNEELLQQLKYIQNIKCETQTLELKSAEKAVLLACMILYQASPIRIMVA